MKIFQFFEKERMNLPTIAIFVFTIIVIRTIIEGKLSPNWTWNSMFNISAGAFYIPQFLGMVLMLRIFTGEKIRKLLNLACWGFPIIIFPPIYDFLIKGRRYNYTYIPVDRIPEMITSFYLRLPSHFPWMGDGMVIQFIFIFVLATLYVLVKSKSIVRAILFFSILYFLGPILVTPEINPLVGKIWEYESITDTSLVYLFHFVLTAIVIGIFILLLVYKKNIITLIKSMNPFTTIHFILMTIIGILVAGKFRANEILSFPVTPQTSLIGITLITNFFLWQYAVWINHIYDIEIDRITNRERAIPSGFISLSNAKEIAILFALFSIALSFILGVDFFITLAGLFLGFIYSVPPIRLRNRLFSPTFVGAGSAMAFLFGVFIPSPENLRQIPYFSLPPVDGKVITLTILIFIVFSIAPLIRQLKDYEGDKKAGVQTIFTVYGKEKGIHITSFLLFFAIAFPLLIFHQMLDALVFISGGTIASFIFNKTRKTNAVFIIYFIILLYCIIRWISS